MEHNYQKLLIKSAQQGKKNAFRELSDINLKKIYNLAVRFILNEKIAEIVTQEIFIEAWNNINFLREEQPFDAWLKGIAIFKLLNELRTKKVREKLLEEGIILPTNLELNSSNKDENIILQLPEKERISFILHDIEKYTYQEISDFINDMTVDEIKIMIRQTREGIINSPNYE